VRQDKLLHVVVNEVRVSHSFYYVCKVSLKLNIVSMDWGRKGNENKPSRTQYRDNVRLLIDGNGNRELVSISIVSCELFFSVFSRTCVELARAGFGLYSLFVSIFADPHKHPMGSTEFQIGCDSHKPHTNYASKHPLLPVNLSFLSFYPSWFTVWRF